MKSIYTSKKLLLDFLGIKENFLYPNFSEKYKEINIPKKRGGVRKISPPNFNLKKVQKKILKTILCNYKQLPCVHGLSKDKGVLQNAQTHTQNSEAFLLVVDIENFFLNISRIMVKKGFTKIGFNKETSAVLTKLCTVENFLPQGAPTSPYIASMVCNNLDKDLFRFCKNRKLIYTRYFDDISISGKNIEDGHINEIQKVIKKHGFNCRKEKTHLFRPEDRKVINGVIISKIELSVTPEYKEELKEKYKIMRENNSIENQKVFAGKLGFFLHINKKAALKFYAKLKNNADINL